MKKLNLLFLTLVFVGCSDVLEEEPKALATANFYNTPAEIEAAVNAIYGPMRNTNALGALYPAQHEAYTDYGNGRGSYGILSEFGGLDNTNITRVGQIWDLLYQSIRNANLVIANAPNGTAITPEQAAPFVAEAKFLRGFIYFIMVRNWGGVPIRTEANATEPTLPRATEAAVYDQIVQDLTDAEAALPATPGQPGRPSTWTAKSVLADVYLHLEQFAEARDKAMEVISSGVYELVPVTTADDFLNVFGPEVASNTEEIFSLKYSRQQGFGLVMFAHIPASRLHGAGGYYAHYTDYAANPFIAAWDDNDLRKSYNLYDWNIGLGNTTQLFKKYIDPVANNANGAGNDYPWYRLADVLLIHAEAASRANNGPTAEAVESLNMVHRRAYGYPADAPSPVDFNLADYNAETFLDEVVKERGYETMYEGKRWLDLKRLGIAEEVILATKGKTVDPRMMYWPIPNSELAFNGALDPIADQNPGY